LAFQFVAGGGCEAAGARKEVTELGEKAWTRQTAGAWAALLLVFGVLLVVEGRPACCKYGFSVWSAAWSHCTSQSVLDPYSFTHVLHGVLLYWALRPMRGRPSLPWRMVLATAIEMGWELLENSPWVIERYRQQTASLDYVGDSIVNSVGDVLCAVVGFWIASRVSWKWAVVVFVVIEVGLLITVRDNLTLNVVMLFWPLEVVKAWQLRGI
jgi:hypothetical protein